MKDIFSTRHTLIDRARDQSDEQAWEEFEEYYREFIRMVLQKMNLSKSEQDDLSQEILIKLWKNLKDLDLNENRAKFRTWMSVVIKNTVFSYFDSNKRRSKREDIYNETFPKDTNGDIEDWIENEWKQHMFGQVLSHLEKFFSGQALRIFIMDLEGKSVDEISETLNIKKNSIYVLRTRVKNRFMEEMKHLREILEF